MAAEKKFTDRLEYRKSTYLKKSTLSQSPSNRRRENTTFGASIIGL